MAPDSGCIFCRIVRGDVPSHAVYQDQKVYAFLDVGPLAAGHLLLIPKDHHATMAEVPPDTAASIGAALPRLTQAVAQAAEAEGVNVLQNNGRVAGQVVEHVHVHLIPRRKGDGLGYRWNAGTYQPGEAESIRDRLIEILQS
jgi:histidine triad (HIT) family protein